MKKLFSVLLISFTLMSCTNNQPTVDQNQYPTQQVSQPVAQQTPAVGFDVQQFNVLLKTTVNPSALEQSINAQGNTINNMDLNNDGNVDFLRVIELQGNVIQVVDNDANPAVTVLSLNITQQGNQASFAYQGNQLYCGSYYNYHSTFTMGDYLFLSYLLRPHYSYYHPYYRPYYHPPYYRPYSRVTYRTTYRTTSPSTYRNSSTNRVTTNTPSKSYTPARTTVSSPTTSQRSFTPTTRNTSTPRSTGFGSSSSSSRPSSSFGSSRSSFGSSSNRSSSRGGRH